MASAAPTLDAEKFRKVHRLMTGGATPGERAAAKARAEAMARKAGMSLADAVSKMDARPAQPRSIFEEMMDADPAWRAEHREQTDRRDQKRAEVRREALKDFGSEGAVFAETERERLLRETLEPYADWGTFSNTGGRFICGYAGWKVGRPPSSIMEPLLRAYPCPADLAGIWAEYREWDRLYLVREAFEPHYDFPASVRIRMAMLEHALDTLPDQTFEGFATRLEWLRFRFENDRTTDIIDDLAMIDQMRFDFGILRGRAEAAPPSPATAPAGPRTNAEKRAAVLSTLDTEPGLSDREIARRLGISPQTVNNWRKRHRGAAPAGALA